MSDAAADERAVIVAWLRAQARDAGEIIDRLGPTANDARRSLTTTAATMTSLADLIEEGAHHAD